MFSPRIFMKKTAFALSCVMLLSACAKTIDPNVYTEASVGAVSDTYQALVLSSRPVMVQKGDSLTDNGWGMILGGGAAGLAGSKVGTGLGQTAAVAGAAVAGAALGALAQQELSKQPAVEYVVKVWQTDNMMTISESGGTGKAKKTSFNKANEKVLTVVQGPQNPVGIGQRAFLIITENGRARLVADVSGAPQVNERTIRAASPE
jgi:outer membrane lipoprotein SlyB